MHKYTNKEQNKFTEFMITPANNYPIAMKTTLIQDNLNTHNSNYLSKNEAFIITFTYNPNSASWLNIIEIEFSALAKQC